MPNGSCACGQTKLSYGGEPQMKALCHCMDCRKISGGNYSVNVVVNESDGFKISGPSKEWTKKADSGSEITSHLCSVCGSTLARVSGSFPGMVIIKAGVVDDPSYISEKAKPDVELYAPERVAWVPKSDGTEDKQGMS